MGALVPVAFLVAAYVGTAVAVLVAIETALTMAIIAAVIAVAATAAATYYYFEGDMKNSMLFSAIALSAAVGGIYATYVETVSMASTTMIEAAADASALSAGTESMVAVQVAGYAQAVYAGWQSIAEALHLKLLFQVHQVAYLVSEDYRSMMDQVFKQVAMVSEAYGFGALTLNLLFENVRTSVLDISTAMGSSYDISEIKWISTYNEILKAFAANAEYFQREPNRFLMWIADNVNRPGYDAKSATVRGILQGVDSALVLVKSTAEVTDRIRKDLNKLVGDLPEEIRKAMMPEVQRINRQIEDWVRLNYDPTIKIIGGTLKILNQDVEDQKKKAGALIDRIRRPGKYLQEIDSLPTHELHEDEEILGELASRADRRRLKDVTEGWKDPFKNSIQEITLWETRKVKPPPETLALEKPESYEEKEAEKVTSPFVGDY